MKNFTTSPAPHVRINGGGTRRIMLDVLIALCPSLVAAMVLFGYHVLINAACCVAFCVGAEAVFCMIKSGGFSRENFKKTPIFDLSAAVSGVILALNLPATMNVWGLNIISGGKVAFSFDTVIVCLIGSIVAIVLVKQIFGGIGKNFANPALTARAFLFLTFATAFASSAPSFDASTGASWLSSGRPIADGALLLNSLIGLRGSAAVGEACVAAVLLGYVYLVVRGVIDFRLPLMIVGFTAVFALLFDGVITQGLSGTALLYNCIAHVLSGGLIFGATFMATDYATGPNTFAGNCIYAFGISLLTVLIRVFAAYPEGVSFAILIMNCAVPLINRYVYPRPIGYAKEGKNDGKR